MIKISSLALSFCLAASSGLALAMEPMPAEKGAMGKDTMKMEHKNKNTMDKKDSMHKDAMHKDDMGKDAMKKDAMDMKDTKGKDKGM